MSLLDLSKPVYRVSGKIPDGRRMTCFVNATNENEAFALSIKEGMISLEKAWEIDAETGLRKEAKCCVNALICNLNDRCMLENKK